MKNAVTAFCFQNTLKENKIRKKKITLTYTLADTFQCLTLRLK